MYKIKTITKKIGGAMRRVLLLIMALMIICTAVSLFSFPVRQVYAEENTTTNKLLNGSFEDGPSFSGNYSQPDQSAVPYWNTTAFQGKIELLKENTGTYIPGVKLSPTDGTYAAELNADEESTLYQNVKTTPSSVYEWGLDHGARNGTDTMALVIGPKQSVNPSKPSKEGRDHFMQMIDWLIAQGKTAVKDSACLGEHLTVYSKKFAANGAFEDNAGNNAFSLTPSTIYTEEWHIWIMASSKVKSGTNPWNSYGSNAKDSNGSGNSSVDLSKYYHYTVPASQTDTLFGFVSVGYVDSPISGDKAKTYGNFLDNINFQIYHPLSGSTTTHGSAVVGGSDGSSSGTGNDSGHKVTVDNKLTTYVKDGEPLTIQAIVSKADADDGCEFVGVYYTKQDESGNPVTEFLKLDGNEIEDTGSLTDEEKKGKWIKSTNDNEDIIYTYYLDNVTTATNLHFVFIKSPTVTYDPNGGKPYEVERTHNTDEPANVYSFKPVTNSNEAQAETGTIFIDPYTSHAAEGQNDDWKFMGWKLTGDIVDNVPTDIALVNAGELGILILPAEHTIACDYLLKGVNDDGKAQYFKVYNGNVSLTKAINHNAENNKVEGVTWTDNSEEKAYANVHKGITMVAQWRWRQAVIPQTKTTGSSNYMDSDTGGTVTITSESLTNENYNDAYNPNGGKSYFAETGEKIIISATANAGFIFEGWYDGEGNLITTNDEYSYSEKQGSVNTYYARFSNSVTQTYIRQVGSGDDWKDTTDDAVGTLGRYSYTDAVGMPISSTATAGSGYKFMGWYDSNGDEVADSMLTNNGATISYTTTGNATYYARFQATITQTFVRYVWNSDKNQYEKTTDDTIATLSYYTHTDVLGATATSKATAKTNYEFVGWYDSSGNKVSDDMLKDNGLTISYTTTGNATYHARFKKIEVTQIFKRQFKNGDSWADTDDDAIGKLTEYGGIKDEIGKTAESTATAGNGYKFVGWYDSKGNKVADDMLAENGFKITYTTTGNATYIARFEKLYTLSVSKIDGDKSTAENKVPIAGVEFTLYKADETGDKTLTYNGAEVQCTEIRSAVTALNSEETEATAVFEDVLSAGSVYYLAETKVPTGYRFLENPVKITIDSTGPSAMVDDIQKEITDKKLSIELANFLTLTMPVSGTWFTGGWVAVIGLLILTSAVIGLFLLKLNRFKSINKK